MDTIEKIKEHIAKRKSHLRMVLEIYKEALSGARNHNDKDVREQLVKIYDRNISDISYAFFELNEIEKIIDQKPQENGA